MEEEYHVIKSSLKSILKPNNDIYTTINNDILRINNLVAQLYQFFRLLLLYEYRESIKNHKNGLIKYNFTIITPDIILICAKVLTKKSNSGKLNANMQQIYNYFDKFYEEHYKHLGYSNKIDGKNLSQSIKYEGITMMTSIENNIIYNFDKYVKQYVLSSFNDEHKLIILLTNEKEKKDKKKELQSELLNVYNDLLNNTLTSKPKYWNWIKIYKLVILPSNIKSSYESDIKSDPQKYIPYMIVMNEYFEKIGTPQYQFFPLRTSGIPNYCTFDTTVLVRLLIKDNRNRNEYLANITENKDTIWDLCFDMKASIFKNNKYKFDYAILTDGYAVSVRFISEKKYQQNIIIEEHKKASKQLTKIINNIRDPIEKEIILKQQEEIKEDNKFQRQLDREEFIKNLTIEEKEKFKRGKIEFPYLEELTKVEIDELRNSIRVYNDPGKRDLIKMKDENGTLFTYSNKQRLHEMNQEKYKNQINKFWGIEIKPSTKKKKRKPKKERKKGRNYKNHHTLGKKENLQLKKNKRKQNKINNKSPPNIENKIIEKKLIINEINIITNVLNKLVEININEQKDIDLNNNHFINILNNNTPKYFGNNLSIFKNLILSSILEQNRYIHNKYEYERKELLQQIKNINIILSQSERIFNNTYKSIEKFVKILLQLNNDEKLELIHNETNLKENIYDYDTYLLSITKINKKYYSSKLLIINNLAKANQTNYELKLKWNNLLELIVNIDDKYNEYKILNTQLKQLVNVPFEFNTQIPLIKPNTNIMDYSKDNLSKILELCMIHQLSNNTIFKRLKNIFYNIKTTIYDTSIQIQESNINEFIKNEQYKEKIILDQTHTESLIIELINKSEYKKKEKGKLIIMYSDYLERMWINNTNKIKIHINSLPHPDPNYISILIDSTNIKESSINNKKIALFLERDLTFLRIKKAGQLMFFPTEASTQHNVNGLTSVFGMGTGVSRILWPS